ncbi:MAG: hypothetical protein AB1736_12275 [Chloroflexota bacterium]
MPRPRKRNAGQGSRFRGSRRRETPEALLAAAASSLVEQLRREATGLAAHPDPLEAELVASGTLAMWRADPIEDRRPLDRLGTAVLATLGARPGPDVLAVLVAIASMADPPFAEAARAAIDRCRAAGVQEPSWSRSIGRPLLIDAWISTDELDDQSHVLAAFAYDRRPPHALNVMIDANFQGLIRGAFVADNPDKVQREWIDVSGLPIRPLSEQALADFLGRGVEWFDRYTEPPVSDEAIQLMPLIRSRLRLLPDPREIEIPETSEAERDDLLAAFATSPEAAGLPPAAAGPGADIARWFIDFACDYGAGDPLRWSPIAVEILLSDWLPRKVILEPAEVEALPEVLRRYVRYSGRRKGLADEVFGETLEAVDQFTSEFLEGMSDDGRAGPAKEIALGLRAAGIDLTDEAAVQGWIDQRNARLGGE